MIKLSINPQIVNKPVKAQYQDSEGELHWGYFVDGHKVSLAYGWQTVELSYEEVFELLVADGWAVAPALKANPRNTENFESADLILIDCDTGGSISELLNNPFYQQFGAGFYTTPSHTVDAPRYRILHRLQTRIVDAERMALAVEGLMHVYGNADAACKDASRLFYGSAAAAHCDFKDETLPDWVVDELVASAADRRPKIELVDYTPPSDEEKRQVIALLTNMPVLDYARWRNIGWGLKAGGFSEDDFVTATSGMMREKSAADARAVWRSGKTGRVTMGTVYHELKTHYGNELQILKSKPGKQKSMSELLYGAHFMEVKKMKLRF